MPLFEWEKSLFLAINQMNLTFLNPIMVFMSDYYIWLGVSLYIIYFLKKNSCFSWKWLLFLIIAVLVCDTSTSYFFKNIFVRLRPCRMNDLRVYIHHFGQRCGGKYGFFSSHAANSFCVLIYLFKTLPLSAKINYTFLFFVLLISYSRIYLGVHFPLDILCGMIWGTFIGGVFSLALKLTKEQDELSPKQNFS